MEEVDQQIQSNQETFQISQGSDTTVSQSPLLDKEEKNKKLVKILTYVLVFIFLVAVGASGFWFYQKKTKKIKTGPVPRVSPVLPSPTPTLYIPEEKKENFDVVLKENPQDKAKTDVYLKNRTTGQEEFYMTLTDIYRTHYYPAEYQDNNLYIIRRLGYEGYPDEEWSDELWKYSHDEKGISLFSSKGIDFRTSPDGELVAIEDDERLIFLDLKTNSIEREFSGEDLGIYDADPSTSLSINLQKWSDNGKYCWVALAFTAYPQRIIKIEIDKWVMDKFDVSDLSLDFGLDLNPNTGKIVFSDYPVFFDVESKEEFETKENTVTLFVYDLDTQNKQTIATSINMSFRPKWLDDNTIEYDDPQGGRRITFNLE